ncbi:hypothetical protein GBAR_LOCUS8410 [Geodia barretti]|uniref:Uncharacterized protein n=1 Tax=Geodia barretti TaxID=519541 RepID=A0AA35WDG3_GEOBA|nr:hypothetical protein GBAR_LOCUS8410 [Geodia barretti]
MVTSAKSTFPVCVWQCQILCPKNHIISDGKGPYLVV